MLQRYGRQAPITLLLISVNLVLWIITALQARSIEYSYVGSELAHSWALWGPDFQHEPWLALTSAFMHVGAGHVLVNMIMLLFIGREVETYLGSGLYALAYVISALGASATILWLDFTTPTVGASGAIFALMALLIGVHRQRGADLRAPIIFVLVNVVYTFLSTGVSLWGHLGGLFTGLALMPFLFSPRNDVRWFGTLAIGAVVLGLLFLR